MQRQRTYRPSRMIPLVLALLVAGAWPVFAAPGDICAPHPIPKITITDATVAEGNFAVLGVNLSNASCAPVTVDYTTQGGNTEAGDYVPEFDTLTFSHPQKTRFVTVQVLDDGVYEESQEYFWVKLKNPSNATIQDAFGKITILSDQEQ